MIDDNKEIKIKIDYFLKNKTIVHISKKNKNFMNGVFVKDVGDGVYLFDDLKFGRISVFLSEIFDVIEYSNGGAAP